MRDDHPQLGYEFHAYPSGSSLGYTELDVFLAAAGQEKGFAAAQFNVLAWQNGGAGGSKRLVLTAHSSCAIPIEVAPGILTIRSHSGGEQDAYCFGGLLTCQFMDSYLHCRLTSSAPILNLGEEGMDWPENAVLRVVDGIESDLAACRASFAGQDAPSFDQRLARTDPRLLYAVGLALAHHSLAILPAGLRTEHYWQEHNTLERALHEAQAAPWWPSDPSLPAVLPAITH